MIQNDNTDLNWPPFLIYLLFYISLQNFFSPWVLVFPSKILLSFIINPFYIYRYIYIKCCRTYSLIIHL